jgi:hypothetical protein
MMPVTETPAQSGRAFNPNFAKSTGVHSGIRCTRSESCRAKGQLMEMPKILQGDSLTRLLQGAAAGAIVTMIIGFNWGGWVTGGTAKDMVERSSTSAVVSALSPICVDKFRRGTEATANLAELRKVSSYQQGSFIEKGGWATLPGSDNANSAVARACGEMLTNLK